MQKHRVQFPALGSVREVPLLKRPKRKEGESDEDWAAQQEEYDRYQFVTLKVRLLSPKEVRAHAQEIVRIGKQAEEIQAMTDGLPKEEAAQKMQERFDAINRSFVMNSLSSISGLDFGDETSETMALERLIDLVAQYQILGAVAEACRAAQHITPVQKKLSAP